MHRICQYENFNRRIKRKSQANGKKSQEKKEYQNEAIKCHQTEHRLKFMSLSLVAGDGIVHAIAPFLCLTLHDNFSFPFDSARVNPQTHTHMLAVVAIFIHFRFVVQCTYITYSHHLPSISYCFLVYSSLSLSLCQCALNQNFYFL